MLQSAGGYPPPPPRKHSNCWLPKAGATLCAMTSIQVASERASVRRQSGAATHRLQYAVSGSANHYERDVVGGHAVRYEAVHHDAYDRVSRLGPDGATQAFETDIE